ncbi:MAG: efflux RND transporter periplasmic adaptor subunit [Ignavibacteriales bacterium]|nr:MAG: efflux RND transporter periplasmic adaptor subunit [Ignavibacteriales bacterium]
MKQSFKLYLLAFIAVSALLVTGCGDSKANPDEAKSNEKFALVKTARFAYQDYVDNITVLGVVKASKTANISAEEGGKIVRFSKTKGDFVQQGDIIAEIDNMLLKSNMDAAKAQYDLAEVNFVKLEKVYKENASSELSYLQAKYQRDAARAQYELIKARFEKTYVRAPFSGFIENKFSEIGEVVAPGQTLVVLVNSSEVKISVGVPENYVNRIKQGDRVKVRFKDLDNKEYTSRVSFVGRTINTANRTFNVEIELSNQGNLIKPELNAEVFIEQGTFVKTITVPENILLKTDAGYVAFVENNGRAEQRVVELLGRFDNKAAIKSGLTDTDNVIIVGYQSIVPGEKVKVMN